MNVNRQGLNHIGVGLIDSDPLRFIGFRTLLESSRMFALTSVALDNIVSGGELADKGVFLLAEQGSGELLERLGKIKAQIPNARIIVTGSDGGDEAILRAITGGAKGYLDEASPSSEFAQAIRTVNEGLVWVPRRIFAALIDLNMPSVRCKFAAPPLTGREKDVLRMLVAGRSNKEIADPLGIEVRTVKAHVAKLMRTFDVQNRVMLSVHAITHSLVAVT